jgi:hypothetical protein
MSFANDKIGRFTKNTNIGTIDAVTNDFQNACMQMHAEWADSDDKTRRPKNHVCFDRVVRKFPTVAEYTATISPIGSMFHQFEDDGGTTTVTATGDAAVIAYQCHVKTDATTIQSLTKDIRHMQDLAGTILVDGAVTESYLLHVDALTSAAGVVPAGTVLTITPTGGSATTYVVIEQATIASNEVTVILDQKITVADGIGVTVTSINALSTDTTITADSSAAAFSTFLPAAASCKGVQLTFVLIGTGTNNWTIDGSGSETIEGATTAVLDAQYEYITIVSNGTAWYIIADGR